MRMTVELTYYPLQGDFKSTIKACIGKINEYPELSISTFPTATVIVGDYEAVFKMLQDLVKWSYESFGKSVFIAKFLPAYEAL